MINVFDDYIAFAETFLYIYDKEQKRVKLNYNPVQTNFLVNRSKRDLVLKARQFGISTAIQAEFFRIAVTQRASIAVLAHDDDTTQKLRRMSNRFWENMPDKLKPARKYSNDRLVTYPDFDSEITIATAGNTTTGRGGTYSHIHGSEVAFWKDAQSIVSGMLEGGNPYIVLESTPNGAQGYFYERCMEALENKSNWKLHFYSWWASGENEYKIKFSNNDEYFDFKNSLTDEEKELIQRNNLTLEQINWRRYKIRDLKSQFWQEYPENPRTCFLLSGNGYFGDVSKAFSFERDYEYNSDFKYMGGLDFGQLNDFTAFSVICKNTKKQVDFLNINRLDWSEMRKQVALMCKKWNIKMVWAEENSMGSTNIEELRNELRDLSIHTKIKPFKTTINTKREIMSSLHEALHEDGLTLIDDEDGIQKRQFNAFVSKQTPLGNWQLLADGDEHDDLVIANALANQACLNYGAGFG